MEPKVIDISFPSSDFESFLKEDNNHKIFFSGKYGIGKTFFLQQFFKNKESEYDVYHLFPVRYQISSNENIIDLLRYDILIELLSRQPDFTKGQGFWSLQSSKEFLGNRNG